MDKLPLSFEVSANINTKNVQQNDSFIQPFVWFLDIFVQIDHNYNEITLVCFKVIMFSQIYISVSISIIIISLNHVS